jgi:hypothetical protein
MAAFISEMLLPVISAMFIALAPCWLKSVIRESGSWSRIAELGSDALVASCRAETAPVNFVETQV